MKMTAPLDRLSLPVHRIIPFSNVEGTGNRTSIFLQGCQLNCLYCHNPETIARHSTQATLMSLTTLLKEVKNAMPFIRGVTVSGGEPTLHYQNLIPFFHAVHSLGLSCYLDSNGFFNADQIKPLIDCTDKFLWDLKGAGDGLSALCFDRRNRQGRLTAPLEFSTKFYQNRNLANLEMLLALHKIEEIRLVVLNGFFDAKALLSYVSRLPNATAVTLKLIAMHAKGTRSPQSLTPLVPTTAEMQALTQHARHSGFQKIIVID